LGGNAAVGTFLGWVTTMVKRAGLLRWDHTPGREKEGMERLFDENMGPKEIVRSNVRGRPRGGISQKGGGV